VPRHRNVRHRNVRQPNYYRILGVSLSADEAEIKRAYRGLAKDYHPDRVPAERREWARAQMARINAAYEVLGDPIRRSRYDYQQGYVSNPDRRAAADHPQRACPARWHEARNVQRVRERARRTSIKQRHVLAWVSAAVLGIVFLSALVWFRWLSLGTPQERCVWAIVFLVSALLAIAALRLTEL
jgi:hypothetical protein